MNKVFTLSKYAFLFACMLFAGQSKAQDFNIQHIEHTNVGNSASTNVTISSVTTSSAVALANNNRKTHGGSSTAVREGDDMAGARSITGATTLTYYRESGSVSENATFNTTIWEYTGAASGPNEFIVRGRYAVDLNGGTYTANQTISGITDKDDVIPFITGIMNDSSTDNAHSATAVAYLTSSTNLRVEKGGTNSPNVRVYITLVEFTGSNWSVLHGDSGAVSADTGTITLYDGSDGTGTATDVSDWGNSIIFTHFRGDTATSGTNFAHGDLYPLTKPGGDDQSVDWTFHTAHDSDGTNRHFVHVLSNDDVTVTRFSDTSVANSTVDITSAGLADLSQAMVVGSSYISGTGAGYGRGWRNYKINTLTQAEYWSARVGGGTATVENELQIIDFATEPVQNEGPGGVTTSLDLWLKADTGVEEAAADEAEDGDSVLNWLDNTINTNDATQATGTNRPTYNEDIINFNPSINFDGTNHEMSTSIPASGEVTIFAITDGNSSTKSLLHLDNGANGSLDIEQTAAATVRGSYTNSTPTTAGIATNDLTTISSGTPYLVNYRHQSTGTNRLFINGITQTLPASSGNTLSGTFTAGIGADPASSSTRWDGEIAELIIYNYRVPQAERWQIESYLGIKYGITIGANGTSQDYVDSDARVIWDQSDNVGYNYNVTGIGKDNASELEQKQSKTVNTTNDITVGIKQIANTNQENVCEFFADKTFLMWGHNNGSTSAGTDITKDFSSGIVGETNSVSATPINRIWKMVVTDSVPTIKLSIPESMVSSTNPGGEDYIMIIADDASFTTNVTSATMEDVGSDLEVDFYLEGTKFITFGSAPETTVNLGNGGAVSFDRTDKYLSAGNVNDLTAKDYTISAWVKRDAGTGKFDVVSKRNYFLENTDLDPGPDHAGLYTHGYAFRINQTNQFRMVWRDPDDTKNQIMETYETIPEDEWHHIAATYDYSENMAILYIDGIHVYDSDDFFADKGEVHSPMETPSDSHFMIGAAHHIKRQQKHGGSVDEVRVWDVALTADQLRYIMNQEIEKNHVFADGKVLPSTTTKNDVVTIPWNNLIAYYPMSTMVFGSIKDESNSGNDLSMINYDLLDKQTAPLPYKTKSGGTGEWDDPDTWENGDLQYLPGVTSYLTSNYDFDDDGDIDDDDKRTIDYNIVEINHDVTMNNGDTDLIPSYKGENRTLLGLIVDNNSLTIDGSNNDDTGNGVTVTHYLELNGEIDLEGESQLIQPVDSDLEVGTSGKLYKDQQGTADTHTYNYWSSPVGNTETEAGDNTNTIFRYTLPQVMKDGTSNINFITSGYDGTNTSPIGLADYWIWKFANQTDDDYASWQHVRSTGDLYAGEGFTMKGPGTGGISTDQNYVFSGKPNNGDIDLALGAGNDYLVGNPYPSAIDAYEFINDNSTAITGTLYFWEHWGGGSHYLADYQGGYHLLNLSGSTTAATQGTNDPDVGVGGTPLKTPGNYIPVSQGFFVVADADGGTINFNNGQRIFHKESDGNSIFVGMNDEFSEGEVMSPTNVTDSDDKENRIEQDTRLKLKVALFSVNTIRRQLLTTVDENATAGVDFGYDGMHNESQLDDMYWIIEDDKFVIQGINEITRETILPLGIYTSNDGMNSIILDELTNDPEKLEVFLHDKTLDIYHNLQEGKYDIYLPAGEYLDRFEITFSNRTLLDIDDNELNKLDVHYSNAIESIVIINPTLQQIDSVEMTNMLGQTIYTLNNVLSKNHQEIELKNLSSGTYIINLKTQNGTVSKKVLVE
jgi:hypothetical protein